MAINAHKPLKRNTVGTVPSFFASWLTTEAAPIVLATWAGRTARDVARRRGRLTLADKVGVALTAGAAVGVIGLIRDARRTGEQLDAALSGFVPPEELADRPRAQTIGAYFPVLNGFRRRKRTRNVGYTSSGPRMKLDVYEPLLPPEPGQRRPAILQIHGGAWVIGSKDEQGIPLLNHLAHNGWVGFNVNYQLSPRSKAPQHLIDCKLALAWVREHADEYDIDPDFIVVTGQSAGGHLCALMALTAGDPAYQPGFEDADTSLQAAVPFYGVYDMLDRDAEQLPRFVELLQLVVMGTDPLEDAAGWEAYSPIDRVTADAPPMFVLHGDNDVLVPVEGARRFVGKLAKTSNNPVLYGELRGAQHAFEIFPSIRSVQTVEYVERFLNRVHQQYLDRSDGAVDDGRDEATAVIDLSASDVTGSGPAMVAGS